MRRPRQQQFTRSARNCRRRVDDAMACLQVACLYQRRRTAMKNCLIKPKRRSVILFHDDAKLLADNVMNTQNGRKDFRPLKVNISVMPNTMNCLMFKLIVYFFYFTFSLRVVVILQ